MAAWEAGGKLRARVAAGATLFALAAGQKAEASQALTLRGALQDGITVGVAVDQEGAYAPVGSVIQAVQTPDGGMTLAYTPTAGSDPILYTLTEPSGGSIFGYAVSQNLTVVGSAETVDGTSYAFRWTPSLGVVSIQDPAADWAEAFAVNKDGTVAVGGETPSGQWYQQAFRWVLTDPATGAGVTTNIGAVFNPGGYSQATGVSDDGTVVVGLNTADGVIHAFRWVLTDPATGAGAFTDIGSGALNSNATAVSGDGAVVVGALQPSDGSPYVHAFRWTQADSMVDLGVLSGQLNSTALAVNHDGSVVVGASWIGDIGEDYYGGTALYGTVPSSSRAFRWTQATGMQDLNTLMSSAGVDMQGYTLLTANAVSADGQFIGGSLIKSGAAAGANVGPYVVRYCDATVKRRLCRLQSVDPRERRLWKWRVGEWRFWRQRLRERRLWKWGVGERRLGERRVRKWRLRRQRLRKWRVGQRRLWKRRVREQRFGKEQLGE